MGVRRQDGGNDGSDVSGFDSTVSEAWELFRRNLTAHVAAMPRGAYITLSSAQSSPGQRGQRPYVDLVSMGGDVLLGIAALPSYLYPDATDLTDLDLHLMGWTLPGKPAADGTVMDYVQEGSSSEPSVLTASAVATFRDVWNVPHPSFLSAWAVGPSDAESGPVNLSGDTPLSQDPARSAPSAECLPDELRSLHTFCQVLGGAVDGETVMSVCGVDALDHLGERALDHARRCARYAAGRRADGAEPSSRLWKQQARSWFDTARSLRAAARHLSRTDRPSQSAGS